MQAPDDLGLDPGRLLIAAPSLTDPHFRRTVVLLLDAGRQGALGVILNRPSEVPVRQVLDGWQVPGAAAALLYEGGPVDPDSALAVATLRPSADPRRTVSAPVGWRGLFDDVGMVDLDAPQELVLPALASLRIFAGYAGWSSGQLEGEIEEGAWFVVDRGPGDLDGIGEQDLWSRVLRRQGGSLAMLATMPERPELN